MSGVRPIFRRLRVYALDPALAARLNYASAKEVTLTIPWEDDLAAGPTGEYVAVVDRAARQHVDPVRRRFAPDIPADLLYDPVDLNNAHLLAANGLQPSDGNPHFHQQMTYAIAMRTIDTFERALGRRIHWREMDGVYARRITLYPHAAVNATASYLPDFNAILFGQWNLGGAVSFGCLSQDLITHEVTHALLDGNYGAVDTETSNNPDVLAFRAGFAQSVALLQRLMLPEVLRRHFAHAQGDLGGHGDKGVLAEQIGLSLRLFVGDSSPFGLVDKDGVWRLTEPSPNHYWSETEHHRRGALLLGAVFDAFNRIYRTRVSDLIRIATEGSGILPSGALHPDLTDRLVQRAATTARQVLDMCVRALDYCPLVDITFGDFLRAIITADLDLYPLDEADYRLAFVEAFRTYGIAPLDVSTWSIDTLQWPRCTLPPAQAAILGEAVQRLTAAHPPWALPSDREALYTLMRTNAGLMQDALLAHPTLLQRLLAVPLPADASSMDFQVHSIWPRERTDENGSPLWQWIIKLVYGRTDGVESHLLAGATLLVDARSGSLRCAVAKHVQQDGAGRSEQRMLAYLGNLRAAAQVRATQPGGLRPDSHPPPHWRLLRVFAFDPSMAIRLETAPINEVLVRIPWEKLEAGPAGEYVEVVDHDPASGCFYEPVDLDDPYILAENGCAPSQGTPQFHQQMVYAVAMRTIRNFERSLGRLALWSSRRDAADATGEPEYVPRLRLYPHALREANAYYSPTKKAILFGYFQDSLRQGAMPVTVFTCLSHDIIAHEVTHALLDGMHRFFAEPSNPDVLAFHEAFADIVALFQHFSLPDVLRHQIAATRGDLASQNQLGELAQEFGSAIGNRGALRSAIGEYDEQTGEWRPRAPDPTAYLTEFEPHARGALLVATIFDAFLTLYRARIADLLRIATKGTGVLPAGHLHPDLVGRLAEEAAASAQEVLDMCIRALDYCPPVDITFGDYLRAIITADFEYDPIDAHNRRIAFMEAFRRHGILPDDVRAFSQESLLWQPPKAVGDHDGIVLTCVAKWVEHARAWSLSGEREKLLRLIRQLRQELEKRLHECCDQISFLDTKHDFEVHSLRPATRVDRRGVPHLQWVIEIAQEAPLFEEEAESSDECGDPRCRFRGGATLLVDAESGRVRYSICKHLNDAGRRKRQQEYTVDSANRSLRALYARSRLEEEPFAVLHRW